MPDTVRRQREFALDRLVQARASGAQRAIRRLEELVVIAHLDFADGLAMRYQGRGIDNDDLKQVARLALVQAVRRWDPERGSFLGFAAPTVLGSIRRHFRDHLYLVRLPRDMQEINQEADAASAGLRENDPLHSPTTAEVAARIGRSAGEVENARVARASTRVLDVEAAQYLQDNRAMELAEARLDLQSAVRNLDRSERHLLWLYYGRSWSQARIAGVLGVSQMQVSRIHAVIIRKLRHSVKPRG